MQKGTLFTVDIRGGLYFYQQKQTVNCKPRFIKSKAFILSYADIPTGFLSQPVNSIPLLRWLPNCLHVWCLWKWKCLKKVLKEERTGQRLHGQVQKTMPFVIANAICIITWNFAFFNRGASVNGVLFFLFCLHQNWSIKMCSESISSKNFLGESFSA